MHYTITLSADQISYIVDTLDAKKTQRNAQISKATRPSQSAKLEILALSELINKFETSQPKTVELPNLEQLG